MTDRHADDSPAPGATGFRWWPWRTRIIVTLVITAVIWGIVDVRVRGQVDPNDPGLHKTDFTVYTEAGAAFFDGRDPYAVVNPRGWGYLYPPLFAILVAPLHALDTQAQVLVWFVISCVLVWGCYLEMVRIARVVMPEAADRGPFGPIEPWVGWTAVAAAALPTLNCLQRGQVGVLQLYLLLLGFRLVVESRSAGKSFLAGNLLALPIVLKVAPLVTVGYVLCEQLVAAWYSAARKRALGRVGSCAAGTATGLVLCVLIIPAGLVGWRANLHHLQNWTSIAERAQHSSECGAAGDSYSMRNQSLVNAVNRFGNWFHYCFAGGPHDEGMEPDTQRKRGLVMENAIVDPIMMAVRIMEGCLLLAAVVRSGRANDPLADAAVFGLACVATLVVAPIARGHYFLLVLPAVAFFSSWLLACNRPRLAVAFAIVPAALIVAHFSMLDIAGRIGLLGMGIAAWFTVAAVVMLRLSTNPACDEAKPDVLKREASPRWLRGPHERVATHKSSTELSR